MDKTSPISCNASTTSPTISGGEIQHKQKIIFLDFDGVLNDYHTEDRIGQWTGLDKKKIELLNQIMDGAPGTEIIISSTWRTKWDIQKLGTFLEERGFRYRDRIIDATPMRFSYVPRGTEIAMWMDENGGKPPRFVVLDDMKTGFEENQIHTDLENGLQPEHVQKAIDILNA